MRRVFIIGACRTPVGKFGGALSSVSAVELASIVIKESIRRTGISASEIEHVCMGCVIQAGLGQNIARQAALRAGLGNGVTAETLNIVCGSGLEAVNSIARRIMMGEIEAGIAGGTESMSNAPYAIPKARFGYRMGNAEIVDTMICDALWDSINNYHMGVTAENICDKYGISRNELDEYSVNSQRKAEMAVKAGKFDEEIVPVEIKKKAETVLIDADEGPRAGTTLEKLAGLKPAFIRDGRVTAGNSSGINDGASAVLLVSEDKLNQLGIKPMAEWVGSALGGVDPSIMGMGPVASTRKLLSKLNMDIDDIDLIEANEAFAAQSIAVARELDFDLKKVNVNGGAIALGHPVGSSGCRILVTLLHEMKKEDAKTGLATLCIGGGMGCSTIVRRE